MNLRFMLVYVTIGGQMDHQDGSVRGASRRDFLKSGALAGAAAAGLGTLLAADADATTGAGPRPGRRQRTMIDVPFDGYDRVRVGCIGVGSRGRSVMQLFLAVPGVTVTAVCDLDPRLAQLAAGDVVAAGQPRPAVYSGSDDAWEQLVERDDVDFVVVATPWDWHFPMAYAAMREGKHVGVETPLATEVDHLWKLVDMSERTRRHCLMLENVAYGQNELRLLRMAHDGRFGELLHGSGGYCHNLIAYLFSGQPRFEWRRKALTHRIGDIYSQHGLAPVSAAFDINRGDRFVKMVSATTPARSLAAYRAANVPAGSPVWSETYVTGDRTVSLLETASGKVIRAESTFTEAAPYTRLMSLYGTAGAFEDYPPRAYVTPQMSSDQWGDWEQFRSQYDHWLWRDIGASAPDLGGHGGMDYIMAYRIVQTMRLGLVPDFDVYDSATWSIGVALSAESLRRGRAGVGRVVEVPDFTRGRWQARRPGLDSTRPS